jgi:hypothetical protein
MSQSDVTTRDLADKTADDGHDEAADDRTEQTSDDHRPLLPPDQAEQYRQRWERIQASFVDEPRDSVEQADGLVADLMQRLAAIFSEERETLESQWDSGDDVSTEDLRVALTRYRSFFDRLLST